MALLTAALTICAWLIASPANADDTYPVRVEVTAVSTASIELGKTTQVQITGTITNVSAQPISWVTVEFWRSQAAITTPEQLAEAVAADAETPSGARLRNAAAGNMVTITQDDQFAPGKSATFTIKADVATLGFTTEGAYRIGVHVRALAADGLVKSVGINRWLIPVVSARHAHAALSVLTSAPSMTGQAAFIDDHLAHELSGRLETLLTLAERPGAQFVLDPALYDEVQALTGQHSVAGVVREPVSAARPWLARLDALIAARRGYRLPYGNPDLATALAAKALPGTLDRAALALPSTHATAALPAAVISNSPDVAAALPSDTLTLTPYAVGASPTLTATTPYPTQGLAPGPPSRQQLSSQQLAEELVGSLAGRPVVRLVSTSDDIAAETLDSTWRSLIHTAGSAAATWTSVPPASPDTGRYDRIASLANQIEVYRSITDAKAPIMGTAQVSLKAQSPLFDTTRALAYLEAANTYLPATPAQLRAQPSVVMSGRESQFPISVTNLSQVAITVRVSFDSTTPQRIDVADSALVTIGAGETIGLTATATATTNGIVPVSAHLASASGRRVGPDQIIEITSTEAGRVGWVIIVASGMLFVGGTVWRVRAVQRERARIATEETE